MHHPISKYLSVFFQINWLKTVFYNLYLFPVKQALKMPILVDNYVIIKKLHRGG
jgi:hypothetical protein